MGPRTSQKVNQSWRGVLLICYFGWSLEKVRLVDCTTSNLDLFVHNDIGTSSCLEDGRLIFEQETDRSYWREKGSNSSLQSKT
jgi:hypothetical protein